ncbi:MAG: hypothetical protein M1405_00280 [Patescibacteria group bacterium]|nr:hypothetical protein [Patescibacteria group bacterium]
MTVEAPTQHKESVRVKILSHGYWPSEHITGIGLMTRLVDLATALENQAQADQAIARDEKPPQIVLPLGHLWGPQNQNEGESMASDIKSREVPPEAIVRQGDAYSTLGEVQAALPSESIKTIDIAHGTHFRTIKWLFNHPDGINHNPKSIMGYLKGFLSFLRRTPGKEGVEFKSVEDIIKEKGAHKFSRDYVRIKTHPTGVVYQEPVYVEHEHNHYAHLYRRWKFSRFGLLYPPYELLKKLVINMPGFDYNVLEQKNRETRTDKGHVWTVLGMNLPFDVYKLNGKIDEASFAVPFLKIHAKLRGIWQKVHPENKKPKPADAERVEIFPVGPVKRTN